VIKTWIHSKHVLQQYIRYELLRNDIFTCNINCIKNTFIFMIYVIYISITNYYEVQVLLMIH